MAQYSRTPIPRSDRRSGPRAWSRALELLATGYQRILTFESPTGGYNWWGNSDPGNRILTAIALMQFAALDSLIEIDERVADRHRAWLVGQQANDGSWASGDALPRATKHWEPVRIEARRSSLGAWRRTVAALQQLSEGVTFSSRISMMQRTIVTL